MNKCCCNHNPCLRYPCCCPTSTTTTVPVPPEVTCEEVAACVSNDLTSIAAGQDSNLDNFCEATRKCVNDGLYSIPLGLPSGLPAFSNAVYSALRALPGYTNSGSIELRVDNGFLHWVSLATSSTTTTVSAEFIYFGMKATSATPTESDLANGPYVVGDGAQDVFLNWGPTYPTPQYYYFAVRAGGFERIKLKWFETDLNQGNIGGMGDLFGPYNTVTVNGQAYNVWMTSFATQLNNNTYKFSIV